MLAESGSKTPLHSAAAVPARRNHGRPILLDAVGRPRSPAALPGHFAARSPRNKGRRYSADPPRVEEIVAVMRAARPGVSGDRLRALVVVLWRSGLRIGEALALVESDLDPTRGSILVRHGKATCGASRGWTTGAGSRSLSGWRLGARIRSGL